MGCVSGWVTLYVVVLDVVVTLPAVNVTVNVVPGGVLEGTKSWNYGRVFTARVVRETTLCLMERPVN